METELVKVLQLKYPTISYTNKLYEGNKKTLLTQTLHRKTLKLLRKIKTFFCLRRAANIASLGKLLRTYFVTIIRTLHGGVLLLVKLQAKSLHFTKSNTPLWIAQNITYI